MGRSPVDLLKHHDVDPNSGCHLWRGGIEPDGYGIYRVRGKSMRAHRAVWSVLRRPIMDETILHHTCGVRKCVNVDHMELLTRSAHTLLHNETKILEALNGVR